MDVEIPRNIPADDLEAAIEKAQADLADACRALPLKTDPIRLVMASHSAVLDVFGRSIRRFEKAVADIIAARSPITDNDRAAMRTAMEDGAYKAVKQEVRRLTRTLDRRLMAQIGLVVGAALVVGLVIGVSGERWLLTHPDFSGMHCADQPDHSRVCWFEVIPAPTQPAPGRR